MGRCTLEGLKMTLIRFFSVALFLAMTPIHGFTQSCPLSLQISYPNGENGCLTDLPISKAIDKSWGKPISEVAKYTKYYSVATSSLCGHIAIGTSQNVRNFDAKVFADKSALSQCPSSCDCAIVIDNGKVLLPKELAALVGTNVPNPASNANLADKTSTQPQGNAELLNAQTNKAIAEVQAAKQKEQEIAKQREIEAQKLADAQKIQDVQARQRAEAQAKEREKQLILAAEQEKQKVILATQALEKTTRLAESEKAERQKDRELLLQLSAELARLRAEAEASKNAQVSARNEPPPVLTKSPPTPPALPIFANRKALVIGNDGYKFVSKLLNAKEDANAIAENLTKVGYKVTLKLEQTEKEMKASLRSFKSQVDAGDEVAIFYAGHGVQLANTNYLLPIDVAGESEEQIKDEAISLQRILDDMSDKKAKFTLAMIDACRDNPFKGSGRSIGGGARGLAPTTAATGQMVVFSAGTGQQALDKLGPNDKDKNGLFTRLFIKEMQKSGITIDQLVRNVRNDVVSTAKSIGHDQVPAIYDQVVGEFYFRK
jgi:hypothetical protein